MAYGEYSGLQTVMVLGMRQCQGSHHARLILADCVDGMTLDRAGLHSHEAGLSLYPSPSFREGSHEPLDHNSESRLHGCIEAQSIEFGNRFRVAPHAPVGMPPASMRLPRFMASMRDYPGACE